MCERDDLAHLDRNCRPLRSRQAVGRAAKRPVLDIDHNNTPYSKYLAHSVAWAGARDPADRPGGWELVEEVKAHRDRWIADPQWKAQVEVKGVLPWWAAERRGV